MPFTGNCNGNLLNFFEKDKNKNKYSLECYDIEPKHSYIIKKYIIKNLPNYNNKFIIINLPYLARNKSTNKVLFNKYNVNDLYKYFTKEIITNIALVGIMIVTLIFWYSIRKNNIELRKLFFRYI